MEKITKWVVMGTTHSTTNSNSSFYPAAPVFMSPKWINPDRIVQIWDSICSSIREIRDWIPIRKSKKPTPIFNFNPQKNPMVITNFRCWSTPQSSHLSRRQRVSCAAVACAISRCAPHFVQQNITAISWRLNNLHWKIGKINWHGTFVEHSHGHVQTPV